MAKRRVGVEYSPSMLEPVCPGAVLPDRALCIPTFSHFLIVNKTSLSPPLSPATVTCSYIVGWHRWALGSGNLVQAPQALRHDTRTTMTGPCSECVPP